MKKVLIIADTNVQGGTFKFLQQLLQYYVTKNVSVEVLTTERCYSKELVLECDRIKAKLILIKEVTFPLNLHLIFPLNIFVEKYFYSFAIQSSKPDLIVISSAIPGKYFGLLNKKIPCLYFLHSYPIFSKNPFHFFESLYFKQKLKHSCTVIASSKYSAGMISKFWKLRSNQVKCIYVGVTDVNSTKKVLHSRINVATIGSLVEYKNPRFWLTVAIYIVNRFPKCTFTWIGTGPLEDELTKDAKISGVLSKISFVGYKANPYTILNKIDIYFQPSKVESQGLAVLEAMSQGIPCIVSRRGGLPELVESGKTGYVVDIENMNEVVNAISMLINKSSLRTEMGYASKRKYHKEFTLKEWHSNLDKLHRDLIAE